jgi:lipoprotein-anchoring transpeptidase ErfK/SrfK
MSTAGEIDRSDVSIEFATFGRTSAHFGFMRTSTLFIAAFVITGSLQGTPTNRRSPVVRHAPREAGELTATRVLRAQILLDRARFSPGEIDGRQGDDLGVALRAYQEEHHLKVSGMVDAETLRLLNRDTRPLTRRYAITEQDVKGPFTPIPADVQQQAQMKYLGYESPAEELGEKFHCSPKLLAEMNPGKSLDKAGESIEVPNVVGHPAARAMRVVVSKSKRTVTAYGIHDRVLAVYPATIGGSHDPLPIGDWKIISVDQNPWFYYDPVHFWNASPDEAAAKLPPGPNNPAGTVWMGLSKPHYGIHGTPDPGHIRHGESAGCIRLTNWDAEDLAHMVRRGTEAILAE